MPEVPSAINNPVISDDAIFAMNIDTKQRFDNVLSNFKTPISYPLPKYDPEQNPNGLNQHELLDYNLTKGALGDALFDPDRRIADAANQKLTSSVSKTATSYGVGVPEKFPYMKDMDKYLNTRFGYDPYDTLAGNEEFAYENLYANKTFVGKVLNNVSTGVGRFLSSVALKLVQTIGYTGSMIWNGVEELFNPQGNNFMADVADNSLSRWAEKAEQNTKNSSLLSVFKPADWSDKTFFGKLLSGPFWTDEVADGAAFMGEMIASTYLLGGLGKVAGLGRIGAAGIELPGALGKGLAGTAKLITGAEDISGVGRWAFLTASESAFEASQGYTDVKRGLEEQRSLGKNNLSDKEIIEKAGNSAAARFKANMLILSVSNAFENRMIFNPLFRRVKGLNTKTGGAGLINVSSSVENLDELAKASRKTYNYSTKLGRFTDWKNPNSKLRFYGGRAITTTAMEGFWEENAQLAAERLSATGSLNGSSFFSQLLKQTGAALSGNDKEAAENIGLGGVIGILGVGGTSKIAGGNRWLQGERRAREENVANSIESYEKYRKEFLSFNDIYQRDENGIVTDDDGNAKVDVEKATALVEGLKRFTDKQAAVDNISDPLFKKNLQHDALSDFVFAAKKAGIFGRSLSKFENLQYIDAKQLIELGFDPNTRVDSTDLTNSIKEFGKIYEKSQESKVSLPLDKSTIKKNEDSTFSIVSSEGAPIGELFKTKKEAEDTLDVNRKDEQRKYVLFKAGTRAYSASVIAQDYQDAFNERTIGSVMSEQAETNTSDVQMFNSLVYQQEALKQFEDAISDTSFFKPHFRAEKKRLQQQIQELAESINTRRGLSGDKSLFTDKYKYEDLVKYLRILNNDLTGARDAAFDLENRNQIKAGELRNTVNQNEYIVRKLTDPQDGLKNYDDYIAYIDSIKKKDEEQTKTEQTDNSEAGILTSLASLDDKQDMSEEGKTYVKNNLGLDPDKATIEEIKEKVTAKQNDLAQKVTPQPVTTDNTTTTTTATNETKTNLSPDDSKDSFPVSVDEKAVNRRVPDEVSADKPVSWEHANKTSTRDSNNLSPDTEQLTSNEYDSMRAEFIKRIINPDFAKNHNFFIISDVFPELYKENKDSAGNDLVSETPAGWVFNSPNYQGEVIVVENKNGVRLTVKDFFSGNKYKNIQDLPVIFSFDKGKDGGAFIKDGWYDIRAGIKAQREGLTSEEAKKEYGIEMEEAAAGRLFVRNNPDAKISIAVADSTSGIHPKTVSGFVVTRFGDGFTIGISIPLSKGGTETQEVFPGSGQRYPKGSVFVKFTGKRLAFPVGTMTVAQYPELYSKIKDTLNYKFKTLEEAQRIRNDFLNVFIATDKRKAFFRIDQQGEDFIISFLKGNPIDINDKKVPDFEVKSKAQVSDVGQEQLNVSDIALKEGYQDFNPTTGQFTFLPAEDYITLIKPKLVTKMKKILDQKGELYAGTVNPYFTFVVDDERVAKNVPTQEEIQNQNFERLENRIKQLQKSGKLTREAIVNPLATELKNNNITQAQYDSLMNLVDEYTVKPIAPPSVVAANELADKKADIEKRRQEELSELDKNLSSDVTGDLLIRRNSAIERINTKYDAELAALESPISDIIADDASKVEEDKNKADQLEILKAKNIYDKYKPKEKKNITKTMDTPTGTSQFSIEFKNQRVIYSPQDNKIYIVDNEGLAALPTGSSNYGKVLELLEKTFPYSDSSVGNTGFAKIDIVSKEGETYTVYAPPTSLAGSQIVISPRSMVYVEGLEGLKQEVNEEEGKKLEEFLNRYC